MTKYDVSFMNQFEYKELKYHVINLVFQIDLFLGTTKQHKNRPQNAGKCIWKSLEFQTFPRGACPWTLQVRKALHAFQETTHLLFLTILWRQKLLKPLILTY